MTLIRGSHLGVYEVRGLLGAGGMGEVYRGFDPRLKREVAIKVLLDAPSVEGMARLEQEARVAGALNHPHIVTVFDIGVQDGHPFVVLELLHGETLRERLRRERVRVEEAVDVAAQVARGLAAAHAKGIVHRDLKPENVFLVHGGHVKILDFGIAKHGGRAPAESDTVTTPFQTETGVVLGTAAYMSPEQASGAALDGRSDLFSFGIMLYELLAGVNPFRRNTGVETLAAILSDEPPDLSSAVGHVAPALRQIVRRCLQKRPEDRFQSAADLAFALQSLSAKPETGTAPRGSRRHVLPVLALGAVAIAAFLVPVRLVPVDSAPPAFEQLSFRRGWVDAARFGPDGATVVYSGAFDAEAPSVYEGRVGSRESRPLGLPSGLLLSVSHKGELAISAGSTWLNGNSRRPATLARVPLAGGAPRELVESVSWADWSPDGTELALVRQRPDGRQQLEYPAGHVVHTSDGAIAFIRVSPRNDRVAYFSYPSFGHLGSLVVMDRSGTATTLVDGLVWPMGLVWDPDGERIWFTAGDGTGTSSIHVMTLTGADRIVYRTPGYLVLQDRQPDGRLLVTREDAWVEAIARAPGAEEERDISWFDVSNVAGITADGRRVALVDLGVGAGAKVVSYLRGTDGSPAVRLSDGAVFALSSDGTRAIVRQSAPEPVFRIIPTGPGESVALNAHVPGIVTALSWFPQGNRIIATAGGSDQPSRCYLADLDSGATTAVTPPDTWCRGGAVSPDGRFVLGVDAFGGVSAYPIGNGEPRPLPSVERGETPLRWSTDGSSVFVWQRNDVPARLTRIGLIDGKRQPLASLGPHDRVGVTHLNSVAITGNGAAYAYSFLRHTSALFFVSGLP